MSINKGLKPNMTKDDPVIPLKKLQDFQEILSETEKNIYISYYVTLSSLCNSQNLCSKMTLCL